MLPLILSLSGFVFWMFSVTSATCPRISAWFLVDFASVIVSLVVNISAVDCVKTYPSNDLFCVSNVTLNFTSSIINRCALFEYLCDSCRTLASMPPTSGSARWRWSRTSLSAYVRRLERLHRLSLSTSTTQPTPSDDLSQPIQPSWTLPVKSLHSKVGEEKFKVLSLRPANWPSWSGSDPHLSTKPAQLACQLKNCMGADLVGGEWKCETWKTWDGKKCMVGKRGTGKGEKGHVWKARWFTLLHM